VTEKLLTRVPTPCIGVCSTGIGDVVCRGCKRFAHEVIHWNSYTDEQKHIIDARLDQFLAQVVAVKFHLISAALLEQQLRAQQIRFSAHKDPHVWLFQLLRAGASQIADTRQFGFVAQPAYADMALTALREQIDREFFVLSEAYYRRYFPSVEASARAGAQLGALDVC
jgi:predicted Fe-S protein YdhL (DUF1289 family)